MNIVLFLGAGFSAPFGLPVMNRFFRVARDSDALTDDEKQFLEVVQRFAHMGVRLISIPRNNLEAIFSFVAMAEQLGIAHPGLPELAKRSGAKSAEHLLRIILRKVYGALNFEAMEAELETFGNLVTAPITKEVIRRVSANQQKPQNSLTIITTNYDIVAETMMQHVGRRVALPGQWLSTSNRTPSEENSFSLYDVNSSWKICKLHGSVNWPDDSSTNGSEKHLLVENRLADRTDAGRDIPQAATAEYFRDGTTVPLLVIPTLFKHQTDPRLEPTWRAAADALRTADHITFVGYSFPESDTYMRYFLGAALVENVKLESVKIIDPKADGICQRLGDDSHYGDHFKDLLRPINCGWTETGELADHYR